MASSECDRLYSVYKTVYQMLNQRGYLVDTKYENMGKEEFRLMLEGPGEQPVPNARSRLTIVSSKRNNPSDLIWVEFMHGVLKQKDIRETILYTMEEKNYRRAIIVVDKSLSGLARQALQSGKVGRNIEVFMEMELMINIMKHTLVPEHILMEEDDVQELLMRYRIEKNQLPRILKDDPVSRFLGLEVGNVVKIIRKSETAGRYVSYRVVVQ